MRQGLTEEKVVDRKLPISYYPIYHRKRYHKDIEGHRKYGREWRNKHLGELKERRKINQDDKKALARRLLTQSVFFGKIQKPNKCERCGARLPKKRIHGHHPDYSKPYDVMWLCSLCHGFFHRHPEPTTESREEIRKHKNLYNRMWKARNRSHVKVYQKAYKQRKRREFLARTTAEGILGRVGK